MLARVTSHLCALLCPVVLTACLAGGAAAAIEDPNQACADLVNVIGKVNAEKLTNAMVTGSRGMMDASAATAGAEQIVAFAKLQGPFRLAEFMAEREYGKRVRHYWYLLLFEGGQPFYVYCQFIKPDDAWQLVDVKFNTDFDKVPVP